MFMSRAAVLEAPRRFALEERPTPSPGGGEAVVRTAATAVCHTDLAIFTGQHPGVRYPVVVGHESTGIVQAVGAGTSRVRVGQRVIIDPIITCGACDSCERGRPNLCRRAGLFGREVEGSLAEHVVLPERYLHPLPEGLSLEAATLIETLATVRHSQERVGISPADAVVVLGQGASGLLHTQLARLSGASPLVAVSRSQWKLDLARRGGATHVVQGAGQDVVDEVLGLTRGAGADVVIESTGVASLLRPAIDMLRPGGKLLVYGIGHDPVEGLTTFPFYYKELTLYGSRGLMAADFEPAIRLVASGAIDLDGFVTARYPLPRVASAFEEYERDPDRILRIVIVPDA
jgi:2-desacetyl-2-hydroxyethyl bacteriochlorophyllide A dehydrogenase